MGLALVAAANLRRALILRISIRTPRQALLLSVRHDLPENIRQPIPPLLNFRLVNWTV